MKTKGSCEYGSPFIDMIVKLKEKDDHFPKSDSYFFFFLAAFFGAAFFVAVFFAAFFTNASGI